MMTEEDRAAQTGDRVKVNYTGKLESGEQFDSSEGKEPLSFRVGGGEVIKGFDSAVLGMKVGEKKTVTIPPEEAYGERNEAYVQDVPKSALEGKVTPKVGVTVALKAPTGQMLMAKITEVGDETVKFDLNPPLAGKTLVFDIELISAEPVEEQPEA